MIAVDLGLAESILVPNTRAGDKFSVLAQHDEIF
jgi:hypothetical protein